MATRSPGQVSGCGAGQEGVRPEHPPHGVDLGDGGLRLRVEPEDVARPIPPLDDADPFAGDGRVTEQLGRVRRQDDACAVAACKRRVEQHGQPARVHGVLDLINENQRRRWPLPQRQQHRQPAQRSVGHLAGVEIELVAIPALDEAQDPTTEKGLRANVRDTRRDRGEPLDHPAMIFGSLDRLEDIAGVAAVASQGRAFTDLRCRRHVGRRQLIDAGDGGAERDLVGGEGERLAEPEPIAEARTVDPAEALALDALRELERGPPLAGRRREAHGRLPGHGDVSRRYRTLMSCWTGKSLGSIETWLPM